MLAGSCSLILAERQFPVKTIVALASAAFSNGLASLVRGGRSAGRADARHVRFQPAPISCLSSAGAKISAEFARARWRRPGR